MMLLQMLLLQPRERFSKDLASARVVLAGG